MIGVREKLTRSESMPALTIQPLTTESEAEECARIMAASEPWITLRRDFAASLVILMDEERERFSPGAGVVSRARECTPGRRRRADPLDCHPERQRRIRGKGGAKPFAASGLEGLPPPRSFARAQDD